MAIHFNMERMAQVLQNHMKWWNGTLERPLLSVTVQDAYPRTGPPLAPVLSQANCTDVSWSPSQLVEAMDEALSTQEYTCDAYPHWSFDSFGPGVLAAFCGAKLDNSTGNVWFFPQRQMEIADIHVKYNPENQWAQRIKAIYKAGIDCWGGLVVMSLPDLGGVLDVAATLRGSENLLMDLYDDPDEVVRLTVEIQQAWQDAYRDFESVLHPAMPGYTDWSGLLSATPSYILQSDFSYMIGNDMFKDFVLPTLAKDVQWLQNTIYHLDGIGELKHLDTLLALDDLNAVQWVYGDGQPGPLSWLDVYRKIQVAGKRMMLLGTPEEVYKAMETLGSKGIYCRYTIPVKDMARMQPMLALCNTK